MTRKFLSVTAFVMSVLLIIPVLSSCTRLSSTKEESETVLTVGEYEVPYELYRYLALNFRKDYPEASEEELREMVLSALLDIYAVIAAAKDYGITPGDDYFEEAADNAVQLAMDEAGGKSEYKKELEESYMNDSVFRFLSMKDAINDELYYAMVNSGDIDDSAENVRKLALGDEFVCAKQVLITSEESVFSGELYYKPAQTHTREEAAALAEKVREKALAGEDFDALVRDFGESLYMMQNTDGYYVCHGMWEDVNENAVFSLPENGISEVTESKAGFSVFKRCQKDAGYIEENIDTLRESYGRALFTLYIEEKRDKLTVKTGEKYDSVSIIQMEY